MELVKNRCIKFLKKCVAGWRMDTSDTSDTCTTSGIRFAGIRRFRYPKYPQVYIFPPSPMSYRIPTSIRTNYGIILSENCMKGVKICFYDVNNGCGKFWARSHGSILIEILAALSSATFSSAERRERGYRNLEFWTQIAYFSGRQRAVQRLRIFCVALDRRLA